jgi:phage tail-like protein
MIMNSDYMVPAFHFRVLFTGLEGLTEADTRFESVSGIQASLQHELVDTTGNVHQQDTVTAVFQPVILRRAFVVSKNQVLLHWITGCLNKRAYHPLPEVRIEVLNDEHEPALTIVLKDVSLNNWSLGELHAQKSGLLMEEIWLSYKAISIQ